MVIPLHWLPSGRDVARLARAPQLAAMRIFARMTTGAVFGQSAIIIPRPMTGCAGHALMRARQRIIAQRMVEIGSVQSNQPKAAPLVIAMARFARRRAGGRKLAMIALLARDIGPHPFVTGNAFSVLRGLLK